MYKFTLSEGYIYFEPLLKGLKVDKPYLKIIDCMVCIQKGYSWNGCTLAPDFKSTYYASLIHDALYQYKINRKLADKVFYNMLKEHKFKAAKLYYLGTRIFGNLFY